MKYSYYAEDINIDLEETSEEIIQVLKYLDGADVNGGQIVFKIDENKIGWAALEARKKAQRQEW